MISFATSSESCEHFRLPLESAHPIRIARELIRQDFYRNVAFELRIGRPIHLSHSALAKQANDLVRTELCANGDAHKKTE
jgi:hypothetical protein